MKSNDKNTPDSLKKDLLKEAQKRLYQSIAQGNLHAESEEKAKNKYRTNY